MFKPRANSMVTRSICKTGEALSRDYSEAVHMHRYAFRDFHLACSDLDDFRDSSGTPAALQLQLSAFSRVRSQASLISPSQIATSNTTCLTTRLHQSTYDKLLATTRIPTWSEWIYEHRI
jgi:hypothetical protein